MREIFKGNVVDLGNFKLSRSNTKSFGLKSEQCQHIEKTLDSNGGIITCDACKKQLSAIWVIEEIINKWGEWWRSLESRAAQVKELEGKTVILKSAKAIERAWRRKQAPCCPHCRAGLMPEDMERSAGWVSFEYEAKRRERDKTIRD